MRHRRVRVSTLAHQLAWPRRRVRRLIRLHGLAAPASRTVAMTPRLLAALIAKKIAADLSAA